MYFSNPRIIKKEDNLLKNTNSTNSTNNTKNAVNNLITEKII